MDVYLVPASQDRYELYCEVSTPAPAGDARPTSLWARAVAMFRQALAEGEADRDGVAPVDGRKRGRVRRVITRRLAEAVAEQRLLWHLRHQTSARLLHPDDLPAAAALEVSRRLFSSDRDKHRRWFVIDALLTIISTPVALLPGPNFLAYYFIFRTVGHFLSMQGAEQGRSRVTWTSAPSPHLTAIRAALPMDKESRSRRVEAIATALGLDRLGPFVNDVADRSS